MLLLLIIFSTPWVFSTNTSTDEVSYVPEPDHRGTVGLFLSCTITYIACIWTAIHADIVRSWSKWDQCWYKLQWMIATAIGPELTLAVAILQWRRARNIKQRWIKHFVGKECANWLGMSGAFLFTMGGFVLQGGLDSGHDSEVFFSQDSLDDQYSKINPLRLQALMESQDEISVEGQYTQVNPSGFEALLEEKFFDQMINNGELTKRNFHYQLFDDKSKAATVGKAIVFFQVLWFFVQIIGRWAVGLTITLLEIHVFIQAVYAIAIYLFWWNKPFDVGTATVLLCNKKTHAKIRMRELLESSSEKQPGFVTEGETVYQVFTQMCCRAMADMLFSLGYGNPSVGNIGRIMVSSLELVNGGLHALAWNSHFPTPVERLLWQIFCPVLAFSGLIMCILTERNHKYIDRCLFITFHNFRHNPALRPWTIITEALSMRERILEDSTDQSWWSKVLYDTTTTTLAAYILSMMYITVESFISIRKVPADAYSAMPWSHWTLGI